MVMRCRTWQTTNEKPPRGEVYDSASTRVRGLGQFPESMDLPDLQQAIAPEGGDDENPQEEEKEEEVVVEKKKKKKRKGKGRGRRRCDLRNPPPRRLPPTVPMAAWRRGRRPWRRSLWRRQLVRGSGPWQEKERS